MKNTQNELISSISIVNELNYLSDKYKLTDEECKNILDSYKMNNKVNITKEMEDFIIYVNGKMFYDRVVFNSIHDIPILNGKVCDMGLFYSLKCGTQYDLFDTMKSNEDIIKKTDFLLAEATPGDYLTISFDEKDYGKIYFISHDYNEDEEYRYLVANSLKELIKSMYIKEEI